MIFSLLLVISKIFGWIYTIAWSLSFYPQPILNWRRQSTLGTTIDFPAINVLGFISYFISNTVFLYSDTIRRQYAGRHRGLTPTVQFNDVVFAGHAVVLSVFLTTQFFPRIWGFDKGSNAKRTRISRTVAGIIIGSIIGVGTITTIVSLNPSDDMSKGWAWIDVVSNLSSKLFPTETKLYPQQVYAISYVKLVVTLVKYFPQVITNYRNRSTVGWSIEQILLDFIGGVLSIAQLGIDSYLQNDWSGITGNPVKFALGNIAIIFDIVFMTQHYILYPNSDEKVLEAEYDPLLADELRR
jgi:cystinosin